MTRFPATAAALGAPGRSLPGRMLALLALWVFRARSRARLRELPPHLLRDIGIGRAEAEREAAKPFWAA